MITIALIIGHVALGCGLIIAGVLFIRFRAAVGQNLVRTSGPRRWDRKFTGDPLGGSLDEEEKELLPGYEVIAVLIGAFLVVAGVVTFFAGH